VNQLRGAPPQAPEPKRRRGKGRNNKRNSDARASNEAVPAVGVTVENIDLMLPSSPIVLQRREQCAPSLLKKEQRLRIVQADDALGNARKHLRIRAGLGTHKTLNVSETGQGPNTRMRGLMEGQSHRISRYANTYRAALSALKALDPSDTGKWQDRMKDLLT
jgi:hypothetical protein